MSSVVLFIVGCEAAGALSALLAGTANNSWYRKLKKPGWNPPSWLFGPVWVVLYALMGVAGYIVYAEPASASRSLALVLFALQLSLNFIWSPLFFRLRRLRLAFSEILVLLFVVIVTCARFWIVDTAAGLLLVPYVLWTGLAAALSGRIWKLNR